MVVASASEKKKSRGKTPRGDGGRGRLYIEPREDLVCRRQRTQYWLGADYIISPHKLPAQGRRCAGSVRRELPGPAGIRTIFADGCVLVADTLSPLSTLAHWQGAICIGAEPSTLRLR